MKTMEPIREIQKRYCSRAMIVAIMAGFGLILAGQKPLGKGLVLGTLFSAINFVLMGETLPHRIRKSRGASFGRSLASVGLRYLLLAVPLGMAIRSDQYHVAAVAVGLFMIQLMILADHLISRRQSSRML